MPAAPSSPNEAKRLAAVRRVRLMGTPAEERFDQITRLAKQLFDVPMAVLDIVGEELAWLKSVQGFDGIEGLRKDSYCHHTVLQDGICIVHDARTDERVCDSAFASTWVFYAGVPLHFDGERVGVLCIGDMKPRDFSSENLKTLTDLAQLAERELQVAALSESQLALALTNEELQKKANIDVLTRIWNRGAILEIIETELKRATDENLMALLMIDIDYFKRINDTYGHRAGDQALRIIAERLRKEVRPMDAIGRYGGEEFLVVLTDIDIDEAIIVGNRICEKISSAPISFEKHTLQVTCSIGCTISKKSDDIDSLIHRADQALYRAKKAGRNCVEVGNLK